MFRRNQGEKEQCTFCGKDGHNEDGCFKVISYPDWWPGKDRQGKQRPRTVRIEGKLWPTLGITEAQYQQLIKVLEAKGGIVRQEQTPIVNMSGKFDKEGMWIVDSGCTEHITCYDSMLKNKFKKNYEPPVTIPNGETIAVEGRGSCTLPNGVDVNDVLHIPKFKCNLLSVSKLSRDLNCAITFLPESFFMHDIRSGTLIGTGKCQNGLYKMEMVKKRHALATSVSTWHKRLGHPSNSKLQHLDFFKGTPLNSKVFCDSCMKAKFSRLPFPVSTTKTHACFDLIHCDIWGKYRTPSLTRASYFLTIVDDFSRATWVYLLKQKHEASMCLKAFHKMVQVQFEKNIRRIRCDNGGEFISNQMIEFYANQGIILETSCIHTPQQNGVVERKHRHLLETARALRFEANLPTRFWGECVLTAAYVINRMPSDVIGNKTPYEVLYNQKPNYDNMRVFGCLAYYKSTETNGDKFKMKGRPGVFLGYPPGTKGYKIFDIIHNKIVISRDVRFIENFFPFANIKVEEEEIFIPPSIWDDEVIEEKPKDLIGEPNETEIGHSEPIEEFEDDFEHHTQTEAPSEDQTEVDVGPEGSQDEDNQFGPTEEPTFNSDSNNFVEPSKRNRTRPTYLDDYEVQLPPSIDHKQPTSSRESSTVHSLAHYVSYDNFTNTHKAFLSAITSNNEPKHFQQAIQDPRWIEAMKKEIQALERHLVKSNLILKSIG
ncbi:putative RNA-directed DNA polymerase [Tanacetum coccineum]|uniref:RNA-directed DNA polymerase n=1 Tax=Tanacetum coccineum TaxID=301880 RepID=A0ABQ5AA06_9ASTR